MAGFLAPLLLSLGLAVSPTGVACPTLDERTVIVFHDMPPQIARGNAVLDVDFGQGATARPDEPIVARVRGIVRGRFDKQQVPVIFAWTGCSDPFADGTSGLIIGRFAKNADGTPIFYPTTETKGDRRKRKGKFADGWSRPGLPGVSSSPTDSSGGRSGP
jgi:hypothetical protein